jgi:hypothetical protein
MAIDKSVNQAPLGTSELEDEDAGGIEIMIGNADDDDLDFIENEDGSMEISLIGGFQETEAMSFDDNLAEHMDEDALDEISEELMELVDDDILSRKEWVETFVDGMDVLGLKYEKRSEPWENACGVYSNLLAEAAIRFQAEAMSETFPPQGPVKTKILGEETKEKIEAAARVEADMNYELTENMVEYRAEHERMLYTLGLAGSAFKKVYFDPNKDRQVSLFIPA